jgi:hypothetical protein
VEFRVYWNRRAEKPCVWSVDDGSQDGEINVQAIKLHRCDVESHWDPDVPKNPDTPSAWFTITNAIMRMEHGVANFFRDPSFQYPRLTPAQEEEETKRRINELP